MKRAHVAGKATYDGRAVSYRIYRRLTNKNARDYTYIQAGSARLKLLMNNRFRPKGKFTRVWI
eukprot:6213273-Pleurochrysis_carterae.AAC.3